MRLIEIPAFRPNHDVVLEALLDFSGVSHSFG